MSNKRRDIGVWMAAAAVLLLVASCASRKKTVFHNHPEQFEWMSAKMNIDVTTPQMSMNNVAGTLRMRRDSIIWLTASVAGMEAVRAKVSTDSVVFVNRLDRTYLADSIAKVASLMQLPATFQEWQSMLLENGTQDQVEFRAGSYKVKVRYSDFNNEGPLAFPLKINKKYDRIP